VVKSCLLRCHLRYRPLDLRLVCYLMLLGGVCPCRDDRIRLSLDGLAAFTLCCRLGHVWKMCPVSPHPQQVAGCSSYDDNILIIATVKWEGTCRVNIMVTEPDIRLRIYTTLPTFRIVSQLFFRMGRVKSKGLRSLLRVGGLQPALFPS
jgi:hypothetical protein